MLNKSNSAQNSVFSHIRTITHNGIHYQAFRDEVTKMVTLENSDEKVILTFKPEGAVSNRREIMGIICPHNSVFAYIPVVGTIVYSKPGDDLELFQLSIAINYLRFLDQEQEGKLKLYLLEYESSRLWPATHTKKLIVAAYDENEALTIVPEGFRSVSNSGIMKVYHDGTATEILVSVKKFLGIAAIDIDQDIVHSEI